MKLYIDRHGLLIRIIRPFLVASSCGFSDNLWIGMKNGRTECTNISDRKCLVTSKREFKHDDFELYLVPDVTRTDLFMLRIKIKIKYFGVRSDIMCSSLMFYISSFKE